MYIKKREAKDTNLAENAMRTVDKLADKIAKSYKNIATNKITFPKARAEIVEQMNDVLMSGSAKGGKMRPIFGAVDEFAIDPKTGYAGTTKEFKTGKKWLAEGSERKHQRPESREFSRKARARLRRRRECR